MKIATITRNPAHSPNMLENDTAMLYCIEQELIAIGHNVTRLNEEDELCGYDVICHMSRSEETLQRLKKAEANGCRVINSPQAVENCSRTRLMEILQESNIQQPQYNILQGCNIPGTLEYPGWVKKGKGWSQRKEDVVYVTNADEAATAVANINGCAIYCKHIEGDIVKFYGVKDFFFTYSYPNPQKTKFGWETVNGVAKRYPFDKEILKNTVFNAAKAIGLEIYGGDCIITPKGEIYIIDFNDFPSFSAVRQEAAKEIIKLVIKKR